MAYQKPLMIAAQDLAEGVYAASGAGGGSAVAQGTYKLALTNSWDGNKQYDITFTNTSSDRVDSLTVDVKVVGTVTSIGGNVSGVVDGSVAHITFNNYGNGIEGNTTVGPIYMAVTGQGEFGLE